MAKATSAPVSQLSSIFLPVHLPIPLNAPEHSRAENCYYHQQNNKGDRMKSSGMGMKTWHLIRMYTQEAASRLGAGLWLVGKQWKQIIPLPPMRAGDTSRECQRIPTEPRLGHRPSCISSALMLWTAIRYKVWHMYSCNQGGTPENWF